MITLNCSRSSFIIYWLEIGSVPSSQLYKSQNIFKCCLKINFFFFPELMAFLSNRMICTTCPHGVCSQIEKLAQATTASPETCVQGYAGILPGQVETDNVEVLHIKWRDNTQLYKDYPILFKSQLQFIFTNKY